VHQSSDSSDADFAGAAFPEPCELPSQTGAAGASPLLPFTALDRAESTPSTTPRKFVTTGSPKWNDNLGHSLVCCIGNRNIGARGSLAGARKRTPTPSDLFPSSRSLRVHHAVQLVEMPRVRAPRRARRIRGRAGPGGQPAAAQNAPRRCSFDRRSRRRGETSKGCRT